MNPIPHIQQLTVTDFRNYTVERIETSAPFVLLLGPNGSGKTNLLEALSLFSPGRGLRNVPFEQMIRYGATQWAVSARLSDPSMRSSGGGGGMPCVLGTAWQRLPQGSHESPWDESVQESLKRGNSERGGRRLVRLNGVSQKGPGAFSPHLHLIWLVPTMDRLFSGPAQDRRRFLDRLVLAYDSEHPTRLSSFEKAMQERNRLLAEEGRSENRWLEALEEKMADYGVGIAAARRGVVEALRCALHASYFDQTVFPWSHLRLTGFLETALEQSSAREVEEAYQKNLRDHRPRDRAVGRTLLGPHRSDLLVTHGPKELAASVCSTGEQKALLLGLLLAHVRSLKALVQTPSIFLLLDEAVAHLDGGRREGLFRILAGLGIQTWMTGTESSLFEACPHRDLFYVQDGKVL